jgi:uncharacterized membrane protein YjjP (DUF1212 family)
VDTQPDPQAVNDPVASAERLVDVMGVVLRAGAIMVRSGAAAFRSRLTMTRIARSLGVSEAEFVVTPDHLQASLSSGVTTLGRVMHIGESGVNMGRLAAVDRLTRELASTQSLSDVHAVKARLDAIEYAPPAYHRGLTVAMLGAACAAFCGAMGGSALAMLGAYVGAALGHLLRLGLIARHAHVVSLVTVCTFASSLAAFLVVWAGSHLDSVVPSAFEVASGESVLASVLYLIPGVPLVTSLLDIIHFDLVAGLARAAYASLVIVCMGVGMLAFLSTVQRIFQ